MKKILYIVNEDWFFISHRLPIALSMQEKGFEIHLACRYTVENRFFEKLGFLTYPLSIDRKSGNILISLLNLFQIYNLIKKVKPSIVHFITIKPIILGGIALHFLRKKPAAVFSISGLGHIFIANGIKSKMKRFIVLCLYKLCFLHDKLAVIFQNDDDKKLLMKNSKLEFSKVFLIPGSGIKLEDYKKSNLPIKPVILFPARLLISKGIIEFIQCAKILKNKFKFAIVGMFDKDNPDCISESKFKEWLDSEIFEYWGYSHNMSETLSKCSIVVLPSYREGFPKVLMEAAACGRPVITTDVPGCRDAICPNKTGLLVPLQNHVAIAKSINYLMSNKVVLEKMSIASRKLAIKKFSIEKVINSHFEIYSEFV